MVFRSPSAALFDVMKELVIERCLEALIRATRRQVMHLEGKLSVDLFGLARGNDSDRCKPMRETS